MRSLNAGISLQRVSNSLFLIRTTVLSSMASILYLEGVPLIRLSLSPAHQFSMLNCIVCSMPLSSIPYRRRHPWQIKAWVRQISPSCKRNWCFRSFLRLQTASICDHSVSERTTLSVIYFLKTSNINYSKSRYMLDIFRLLFPSNSFPALNTLYFAYKPHKNNSSAAAE